MNLVRACLIFLFASTFAVHAFATEIPLEKQGSSGNNVENSSTRLKAWERQVAAPLRSIINKAKDSSIPVYLPSYLEAKDFENRPVKFFVLDNDTFPLSFGPKGYTIWLGNFPGCEAYSCMTGLIEAEAGLIDLSGGESISLPNVTKAAYFNNSGGKDSDEVIFHMNGASYTFEFGVPGKGKETNIRIAESALQLGPLPK
jgi:hypothetical protein